MYKVMDVLVIEDDKLTLNALKHVIEGLGHGVTLAENAEQAIGKISDKDFDLIICDIMMPGISGLSLLTMLRSVQLVTTPIIAMSTLNNESVLDAAHEAGANDFMAKPFSLAGLTEMLNKFDKTVSHDQP